MNTWWVRWGGMLNREPCLHLFRAKVSDQVQYIIKMWTCQIITTNTPTDLRSWEAWIISNTLEEWGIMACRESESNWISIIVKRSYPATVATMGLPPLTPEATRRATCIKMGLRILLTLTRCTPNKQCSPMLRGNWIMDPKLGLGLWKSRERQERLLVKAYKGWGI